MSEVKFSKEHEWITLEGEVATIGITCLLYTSDAADE